MVHCGFHHGLPLGRKLLQLAVNLTGLLLLCWRQMFPGFHAVQHALLLLRGQSREMLQPLPQLLLLRRWQTAECGIALQCAFLLSRRHILVAAKPVAGMSCSWERRLRMILIWMTLIRRALVRMTWSRRCLPCLHGAVNAALRDARIHWHHNGRCRQHSRRHPSRHEICPPHSPRLKFTALLIQPLQSALLRIRLHIVLHFQVIQ